MSKTLLFSFLALLILAGASYAFLNSHLPSKARELAIQNIQSFGFQDVSFKRSVMHDGQLILKNVSLDEDGFSKIGSVIIAYNWLDLIRSKEVQSITLQDMDLTGEMNEQGNLSLAGWEPEPFPEIDAQNIYIRNGNVDILWLGVGGINLKYDVDFEDNGGGMSIIGALDVRQKQVEFESALKGYIKPSGAWNITLDIQNGKVDVHTIKASRITGQSQIDGVSFSAPDAVTQLTSGNVTLFGVPWRDVSATIEGLPGMATIHFGGKSPSPLAQDTILEFSATTEAADNQFENTVYLYGPNLDHFVELLKKNDALNEENSDIPETYVLSNGWIINRLSEESPNIFRLYGSDEIHLGRLRFSETAP